MKIKYFAKGVLACAYCAAKTFSAQYLVFLLLLPSVAWAQSYELSLDMIEDSLVVGENTLRANILSPNLTAVSYSFARTTRVSPFWGGYSYKIQRNQDEIIFDMMAVLSDIDAYISSEIKVDYEGDKLSFPRVVEVNMSLPDLVGTFELIHQKAPIVIKYEVVLSDRRVENKKQITIQGRVFEAFQVASKFRRTKFVNGDQLSELNEVLVDWIIPEVGIVERNRVKGVLDYRHQIPNRQFAISKK